MLIYRDEVELENANGFLAMVNLAAEVQPDGEGELEICAVYLVQKLGGAEKLTELTRNNPMDFLKIGNAAYAAMESLMDVLAEEYAAFDPAWSAAQYSRMIEDQPSPIRL